MSNSGPAAAPLTEEEKQQLHAIKERKKLEDYKLQEEEKKNSLIEQEVRQRLALVQHVDSKPTEKEVGQERSVMDKYHQILSYNQEAVCAEAIMTFLLWALQLLFPIRYMQQKRTYENALEADRMRKDDKHKIAYDPEKPPKLLYHLNEETQTLDFKNPLKEGEIPTRSEIRANGYVPPPDFMEALEIANIWLLHKMNGISHLGPQQKQLLFAYTAPEKTNKNSYHIGNALEAGIANKQAIKVN